MHTRLPLLIALVLRGTFFAHVQPTATQTGERCFSETGFCIAGSIHRYWERNGGLLVFGYPISPPWAETAEHRTSMGLGYSPY